MKKALNFYKLHVSSENLTQKYTENPEGKVCRFCKRAYPEVTFRTLPHVVPELFGRNTTSSNFECDNCNSKFQKYESDTSTMVQHYLTLLNIRSKKGVPIFKSRKKGNEFSSSIQQTLGKINFNFGNNASDFSFDDTNKTLTINLRTRKFSVFSVYKVFLKMGISLLSEEELKLNEHFLDFLNADKPIENGMQVWSASRYMLRSRYYPKPIVELYKAEETLIENAVYPEYMIILYFANVVFQFFLPISAKNCLEHNHQRNLTLEIFPSFVLDGDTIFEGIQMYHLALNETEKVAITDTIVLHYESREPGN